MFLLLALAILHFVIFYTYSSSFIKPFVKMNRVAQGLWIFALCCFVSLGLFIYYCARWYQISQSWIQKRRNDDDDDKEEEQKNCCISLYNTYDSNFGINGKYYLIVLVFFECFEDWWQLYNLANIYSCSFPVSITCCICLLRAGEASYRACKLYPNLRSDTPKIMNVEDRDLQIIVDIALDLIFLICPLGFIRFVYKLHISITECIILTSVTTVFMLNKIHELLEEIICINTEKHLMDMEEKSAKNVNRRRQSIFGIDFMEKVSLLQNIYFSKRGKIVVFFLSVSYSMLMIIIMVVHLAQNNSISNECSDIYGDVIWDRGCEIKVPFCKDLFVGSCDCASIDIKGHNMTRLPEKFVNLMSLKKIKIRDGPLKILPKNMEILKSVQTVDFSLNKLQSFNVDIKKWKHLTMLYLMYNNITQCNQVWSHPTLVALDLGDNIGMPFPAANDINLPNLNYLGFTNNSVVINEDFGAKEFPFLFFLYLSGNKFISLKENFATFSDNLLELGVARCDIKHLPLFLKDFKSFSYLDARDNNISSIEIELQEFIVEKQIENYFSGNSLCRHNDGGLNCEDVCSQYCWSEEELGNEYCDSSCNSAECNLDEGDCVETS